MQKGEKKKKFSAVIDTGVLIEYINEKSENHEKVKELIDSSDSTLYVTPISLSEVLYVSYRIYKVAGLNDANNRAKDFVKWLSFKLNVTDINQNIIIEAGEIKEKYGIALPDCYVIATANYLKVKALFKKEKEIVQIIDELRKDLGCIITFIDEI
ncbi:PIN domain-containing protein [Stygiolobus caldivivus]|uniref:PIN domain nuclease n=1 Tax=Stygiolobus caldivivus TaxID=2824673 RepID=A0A8D5ZHS6_9CREN|nr:PIN domain-containing protein [Stygiolobus caldivivus]BCU68850.1 PIN domain nuclease [Stygiolobus caldivivus]